jgi:hypothetical protein
MRGIGKQRRGEGNRIPETRWVPASFTPVHPHRIHPSVQTINRFFDNESTKGTTSFTDFSPHRFLFV